MKIKPNKENSSVKQALLDLKSSGGDANAIDILLDEIERNETLREEADKLFQSHQYPEHSLNWCKLQGDVEFTRFLSPNAVVILITMCQNMHTNNLIQISCRNLLEITHISSPKAIQSAIMELLRKGCITEMVESSGRRPAIYMVNPDIATVGKKKPFLKSLFWDKVYEFCPTDEDPKNNTDAKKTIRINGSEYPESSILIEWLILTKQRSYHKGAEYWKDDSGSIRFGKVNILEQDKTSTVEDQAKADEKKKADSKNKVQQKKTSNIISFSKRKRTKEKTPDSWLEEGDEPLPFY